MAKAAYISGYMIFVYRQSKLYVIRDEIDDSGGEITGLAIRVVHKSQLLFVTTRSSLTAHDISGKDKNPQVSIHT